MSRKFKHTIAKICLFIGMGIGTMHFLMNMFMYFTDKVPVLGGGMTFNSAYIDAMKIGIVFGYIISPLCYAYATNFKGTKSYVNYIIKEGSIKISELLTGFLFGSKMKNGTQNTNSVVIKKQSTRNNERLQQNTGQTPPCQIDQHDIDALKSGFDISLYKNELTTGRVRAGAAYDALEELIKKYDYVLDNAIDNYKHAKKWQGYSGTASDGTIEIIYTDSVVHVSCDLGRFTVSHSEANRLESLKSFAPYIDAIDY